MISQIPVVAVNDQCKASNTFKMYTERLTIPLQTECKKAEKGRIWALQKEES